MAARNGYPQIAWRMSKHPELAIVRRFQALNLQNVLYLQAELTDLEDKLREQEDIDRNSQNEMQRWNARSWTFLHEGENVHGDGETWRLFEALRSKLQEYNAALAYQTQLTSMLKPELHNLEILRGCMKSERTSDYLMPPDQDIWINPDKAADLVAISQAPKFDPFTQWLLDIFLELYHRLIGRKYKKPSDPDASLFLYDDNHIRIPAAALSVAFASTLPVLAIIVLHFVGRKGIQLGIIAVFTCCFSLTLALFTNARGVENFAATAAFAAVQVVFIAPTAPS